MRTHHLHRNSGRFEDAKLLADSIIGTATFIMPLKALGVMSAAPEVTTLAEVSLATFATRLVIGGVGHLLDERAALQPIPVPIQEAQPRQQG